MEGFNVCVGAEWKWLYLHSQQKPSFYPVFLAINVGERFGIYGFELNGFFGRS